LRDSSVPRKGAIKFDVDGMMIWPVSIM